MIEDVVAWVASNLLGIGVSTTAIILGFAVLQGRRMLHVGRAGGGFIESLIKYGMVIAAFVTVGIALGWVNAGPLFDDLLAGGGFAIDLLAQGARWVWGLLAGGS